MSEKNWDKDVGQTGDFFKYLHGSMKGSMPFWDDFLQRGQKFQRSLEQAVVAFNSFLDGFAKLAELATNSKGATHEIGSSLTNMIRWQKALELKIRELNFSLSTKVLTPVGHRLDEWKKQLSNLDKDHDKEMNRPLKEAKELLKSTIKAHKTIENKKKKDKQVGALQAQYEQLQMETDQRIADVEQKEKVHMSRVMVEERVWYTTLINAFMTVLDQLVTVGTDFDRLPSLMSDLKEYSSSPSILPEAKRDFIEEWQIPSYNSPRLRGSSITHLSTLSTASVPRADSAQSFDSLPSSDINISSPIMPPTPPPQEPPSLAGLVQPPPVPQPPLQSYNSTVPEDHYDVPVTAPYVSVSPSQVSLVSNGSHNSSESNSSSTRSASPQLSRSMMPHQGHQYPPTSNGPHPQFQATPSFTHPSQQHHQPVSAYQSPVHQQYHNDLPFVNRSDMTPSTMKYIPATLPRPRKDSNPRPVAPKPRKVMSMDQYQTQQQNSPQHHQNQPGYYQTQQQNSPQHYQQPRRLVKQSSLPEHDADSDDDGNLSAFALALKQKKLKKTIRVNDKSGPHI